MSDIANTFRTGKLNDSTLFAICSDLLEKFPNANGNFWIGDTALNFLSNENVENFSNSKELSISKLDILADSAGWLRFGYRRGIASDANQPDGARQNSAYYDEMFIRLPLNTQKPENWLQVYQQTIQLISRYVANLPSYINDQSSETATDLLNTQLKKLSLQYENMIEGIDKRREKLEEAYNLRSNQLDNEQVKKNQENEHFLSQEKKKLEEKEAELEAKSKALDNRHHMHVRRDLRDRITQDVKKRLEKSLVPVQSIVMRWSVFGIAIIAASFLGLSSYLILSQSTTVSNSFADLLLPNTSRDLVKNASEFNALGWVALGKATLSALGAVSFLLYGMSWLRKMYHDDVNMRNNLERYSYDIDRASWAIETILEMGEKTDSVIPSVWIEGVCANLFQSSSDSSHHPSSSAELLASILGASANAKIGSDGFEFELNRKGSKKIAKEVSE